MKNIISLILVTILISSSFEKECTDYIGNCPVSFSTKIQCHKFDSGCEAVEIDNGCQLDSNGNCQATSSNSFCYRYNGNKNKCREITVASGCKIDTTKNPPSCELSDQSDTTNKCFYSAPNQCSITSKTCSDQDINNCNEFSQNCYKLTDYNTCQIVSYVDTRCKIDGGKCIGDTSKGFDEDSNECALQTDGSTINCVLKTKSCSSITVTSKCDKGDISSGYTCLQAGQNICKEFKVNSECKINSADGTCISKEGEKDCRFSDEQKTICQLYEAETGCQIDASDKKCKDGTTEGNKPADGKICAYVNYSSQLKTICTQRDIECSDYTESTKCESATKANEKCSWAGQCNKYTIDTHCTVEAGQCKNSATGPDAGYFCLFDITDKTKCVQRKKECNEYATNECEGKVREENSRICSLSSGTCKEFKIESPCTVTNGVCGGTATGTNMKCLFGIGTVQNDELECKERSDTCESYTTECANKFKISSTSQCLLVAEKCKEFLVDETCQVDSNGKCVFRNSNTAQKTGICDFTYEPNKIACKIRTRSCTEYTDNTCNDSKNVANCAYHSGDQKCYTIEDPCTINNGNCEKKSDGTLEDGKKCAFTVTTTGYGDSSVTTKVCEKVDKICEDYDDTEGNECTKYTGIYSGQCYKFSGESKCRSVYTDNYCKVDEDNCVPVSDSAIDANTEQCVFNRDKTKCTKKSLTCSEIKNDADGTICNGYKYNESKNCFTTDSQCKEVKIDKDNGCEMSNNECKGDSCKFDGSRCYYEEAKAKSSGNNLKFSKIIINLALLFLF